MAQAIDAEGEGCVRRNIRCGPSMPLLTETAANSPPALKVHAALILVQVIFGGGAVIGQLGVATFNPLLFALIREGVGGSLLLLCAFLKDGLRAPQRQDF